MKRGMILLIFVFIFFNLPLASSVRVTGEAVTGKASTQSFNASITVIDATPNITIIKPENKTYITNESLLLNFTSSGTSSIWYHIDNSDNITITALTYFNISEGNHIISLYANNTNGTLAVENKNFTANATKLIIRDDEYEENNENETYGNRIDAKKGNSTDFLNYDYEELQNLNNIILENTDYGKITFNEIINLTNDLYPDDNEVDIDAYTNISSNKIEINSTALPNFNKSATLSFYGLTFTDPRILRDNEVCPATICTKQSYSGGILIFNVTGFAIYSSEETPTPSPSPPGGGGGGGSGKPSLNRGIEINKENIKIKLKQGESKKQQVIIRNSGETELSVSLSPPKLAKLIKISDTFFQLKAGEIKIIAIEFTASKETVPDLYTEKLILKADGMEKEISIAIEVETKKPLFDIEMKVRFSEVTPGEEVTAIGTLHNIQEETGIVDVLLEYGIKDEEDNLIIKESETKSVEKEAMFIKSFEVSEKMGYGNYIFYAKAVYNGEAAIASSWFSVTKTAFLKKKNTLLAIAVIIMTIILSFVLYKISELEKSLRINEDALAKIKLIKSKRR